MVRVEAEVEPNAEAYESANRATEQQNHVCFIYMPDIASIMQVVLLSLLLAFHVLHGVVGSAV